MSMKSKAMPPEEFDKIMVIAQKENEIRMQPVYKQRLGLETQARVVIKDKLEARKKLNLHNGKDWKIRFYEEKLDRSFSIGKKLRSLIKK